MRYQRNCSHSDTYFFYKWCFFSTQVQWCLTFSWIQLQMLLRCGLIYITEIHFMYSIFVSMSGPRSIYVVFMWSIFPFQLIFIVINHITSLKPTYFKWLQLNPNPQQLSSWTNTRPNGWVFVYILSSCGFESSFSHLNLRYRTCFVQGFPWHPGNYRLWIHSETGTWHDKNIQANVLAFCIFF